MGPCVIYKSKISGHVEVYYSMHMYAGTCMSIAFTSDLCRDMFIASFFNKLNLRTEGDKYILDFVYKEDTMETEPDTDLKAKVDKAIIIVSGTKEEPYFEILYHLLGEDDDRIGFGSYCLTNVFNWREQYLEVVSKEDK